MAQTQDHPAPKAIKLSPAPKVLIVSAPFYTDIAQAQLEGAKALLSEAGAEVDELEVPGALEIPVAIAMAAEAKQYEGYVALGCVIRGETTHYETVCNESSRGLMDLGVGRRLAIGNGILTVENRAQAEERADPKRLNKGGGAAEACLHLIQASRKFHDSRPSTFGPDDEHILLA